MVPPDSLSLYQQLRERAANAPLSELLPALLLLAQELKHAELEKWARLELGGYLEHNDAMTNDDVVPPYRTVAGQWSDLRGSPLIITQADLSFVNEIRLRHCVPDLEALSRCDKMLTA